MNSVAGQDVTLVYDFVGMLLLRTISTRSVAPSRARVECGSKIFGNPEDPLAQHSPPNLRIATSTSRPC